MKRAPLVALGLIAAVGCTGVAAVMIQRGGGSSPARDRAALLESVDLEGHGFAYNRGFTHLAEMLPNVTHTSLRMTYSDSVVVGRIVNVTQHTGVRDIAPGPGKPDFTNQTLPFDSPLASWRNLKVTVDVSDVVAGKDVEKLTFDWPVMGSSNDGEDAAAIGRALMSLGQVMVTSKDAEPNIMGLTRKLTDPKTGLAQVGSDGTLSFPLLGHSEAGAEGPDPVDARFTNGVDTIAEVREAARKPTWQAS